jgi:hypothetical protein
MTTFFVNITDSLLLDPCAYLWRITKKLRRAIAYAPGHSIQDPHTKPNRAAIQGREAASAAT